MRIHLACSGGIGNLRIEGQVDTSELPEEQSRKIEEILERESLAAHDGVKGGPFMMDSQQYELTVMPEDAEGEPRRYHLDDSALPDDLIDALDTLRSEIVRSKADRK